MRQSLVLLLVVGFGLTCSVVSAQDPNLVLTAPSGTISVAAGATGSTTASVVFDNTGASDVDGWSFGVCHDGAVVSLTGFTNSALVQTINAGMMPGFGSTSLVGAATGGTQGIVIDLFGAVKLAPGTGYAFVDATYTNLAGTEGQTAAVAICNTLGNPPVADVIVISGASITPTEAAGSIAVVEVVEPMFIRGECNGDGTYDIADGVFTLNFLFQGGSTSSCVEACDANNDGTVDSADAVYTFTYQFFDGPAPAAPFPGCGIDDMMGANCASFAGCP
ncbi:MAG: hypothetical protein AB7O52_14810 [Planctomycetota bacterium]